MSDAHGAILILGVAVVVLGGRAVWIALRVTRKVEGVPAADAQIGDYVTRLLAEQPEPPRAVPFRPFLGEGLWRAISMRRAVRRGRVAEIRVTLRFGHLVVASGGRRAEALLDPHSGSPLLVVRPLENPAGDGQ